MLDPKYQRKDVVVCHPMYGGHTYIVLEVTTKKPPYKYRVVALHNHKYYNIEESQISEHDGQVSDEHPLLKEPDVFYDVSEGQDYADRMAASSEDEDTRKRWDVLARLRPGDVIRVTHRYKIVNAEFKRINFGKPKFVFAAKFRGRTYNFSLASIWPDELDE